MDLGGWFQEYMPVTSILFRCCCCCYCCCCHCPISFKFPSAADPGMRDSVIGEMSGMLCKSEIVSGICMARCEFGDVSVRGVCVQGAVVM